MMRVLFVSDYNLEEAPGGAQISNSIIIEKGRQLGYEIIEHYYSSSSIDFLSSYDLLISSNLAAIKLRAESKLPFIFKHPNHIRLEHDSCLYLSDEERKKLFTSSKKNFFLSDFHAAFFKESYGDYFRNIEIVYDPLDTNIFKKAEKEKIYDVVYCGYLHPLKGLKELIQYFRNNLDRKLDIFGWSDESPETLFARDTNIRFHGSRSKEEIANILQQSKALYHSPVVNEPFCRMAAEAILCGVEEHIGDKSKIGAYCELEKVGYDAFKLGCEKASEKFWEKATQ